MSQLTGAVLIGNAEVYSSEQFLTATNPADGRPLEPRFLVATQSDVDTACVLAWSAFDQYRALDYERRAGFLVRISQEIEGLGDELLDRAHLETNLAMDRLSGERSRTCLQLRMFADLVRKGEWLDLRVDQAIPDRNPFPRSDLRLRQVPLGPVAVFGASNFPLAFSVAGGDTASALAAGCPVVAKGHPSHLGTGELIARAILRAVSKSQIPDGVFSYLPGEATTGAALVQHHHIKAVGFTGSRSGGLALKQLAANRPEPIPVFAEMSSVNPVFVLPEALKRRPEAIAKGYAASLTMGAGQYCTNPGLVFLLQGDGLEVFLDALKTELGSHQPVGMLSAGIYSAYEQNRAIIEGAPNVAVAAESPRPEGLHQGKAAIYSTDFGTFRHDPRLASEVFGATSLVVVCEYESDLRDAAEGMEGQLTATLQLDPPDTAVAATLMPVLERKAGRILANGWPTGVEVADAMVHGGPFPATSDSQATSVGTLAVRRFLRPVCYQDVPVDLLPPELAPRTIDAWPHIADGKRKIGEYAKLY